MNTPSKNNYSVDDLQKEIRQHIPNILMYLLNLGYSLMVSNEFTEEAMQATISLYPGIEKSQIEGHLYAYIDEKNKNNTSK